MIKSVIIEDEKPIAKDLAQKLKALNVEILATIDSVESGKQFFTTLPEVDLVFADIQLGDGLSFEIFREFKLESFIVFTTAFDEYTLQAFEHNSIDYLLKPITTESLKKALIKYKRFQPAQNKQLEKVIQTFIDSSKYKSHLLVKQGNFYHSIPVEQVSLVFSEFKNTYLQTHKKWLWDGSLKSIENELNPAQFFTINRKNIINRDFIEEIKSYSNSRLQLKMMHHPNVLVVSRERVSDFKEWLGK